jgi:alginate O-acetyltransferase complex protein AlgI
MAFDSPIFLFFLILALTLFYVTPARHRWTVVLLASFVYYALASPLFLPLLAAATLCDFGIGRALARRPADRWSRVLFLAGLALNFGMLVAFKYSAVRTLVPSARQAALLAPLGLAYLSLKKITYLVDLRRARIAPAASLRDYALYVFFFPAVTAGPIDRPGRFLPQLTLAPRADESRFVTGAKLMLWGLLKKLVIANNLAVAVNAVFALPRQSTALQLLLATIFYSIQLYSDFSGYTDMARGIALLFGLRLEINFDKPFLATSLADFWRRWHISLATWLRDAIFLPVAYALSKRLARLPGRRPNPDISAYIVAAFCTMLACGLWHNARWTFLAWGALHAAFLSLALLTRRLRQRLRKRIKPLVGARLYTRWQQVFTATQVGLLWVVFRSTSLADARYILTHLWAGIGAGVRLALALVHTHNRTNLYQFLLGREFAIANFSILIALLTWTFVRHFETRQTDPDQPFGAVQHRTLARRWAVYYTVLFWLLCFGHFDEIVFIYRQF